MVLKRLHELKQQSEAEQQQKRQSVDVVSMNRPFADIGRQKTPVKLLQPSSSGSRAIKDTDTQLGCVDTSDSTSPSPKRRKIDEDTVKDDPKDFVSNNDRSETDNQCRQTPDKNDEKGVRQKCALPCRIHKDGEPGSTGSQVTPEVGGKVKGQIGSGVIQF